MMGDRVDGFRRERVELDAGPVHYSEAGSGQPIVFVHGFGANGLLWSDVASTLSAGHRCIVPDWPLGSHPEAMHTDADLTPRGVARLISDFLSALDLDGVTIVGNDSGGAVSQMLVTEMPERIGRLVLTNCDCFENFPPGHYRAMAKMLRIPGTAYVMAQSLRLRINRRSPISYGALTAAPIDDEVLRAWTEPQIHDAGVRRDGARFFAAADTRDTMRAAERLPDLQMPALIVWGDADRFFGIDDGRRLADLIPDSTLVVVEGGRTFLPFERPGEVAVAIEEFIGSRPLRRAATV
jgi:pimeloyl-ACP methyl ester carboxylesterase